MLNINKWLKTHASEFINNDNLNINELENLMIHFAREHVEAALKKASENCKFKIQSHFNNNEEINNSIEDCIGNLNVIDKNSIINSYPLENIK